MKKFAIEGINGAGKTPTINSVVEKLKVNGVKAETYAPYHLVRSKIDLPDIYPMWDEAPEEAVSLLQETITEIEDHAGENNIDIVIFDRHWVTAFTQKDNVQNIEELWGSLIVPTVLLTSPIEHVHRLAKRNYEASWLQRDTLTFYQNKFEELYKEYPGHFIGKFAVYSSTQNLNPIAEEISQLIMNSAKQSL